MAAGRMCSLLKQENTDDKIKRKKGSKYEVDIPYFRITDLTDLHAVWL